MTLPSPGEEVLSSRTPKPTQGSTHAVDQRLTWHFPTVRHLGHQSLMASHFSEFPPPWTPHPLVPPEWPSNRVQSLPAPEAESSQKALVAAALLAKAKALVFTRQARVRQAHAALTGGPPNFTCAVALDLARAPEAPRDSQHPWNSSL